MTKPITTFATTTCLLLILSGCGGDLRQRQATAALSFSAPQTLNANPQVLSVVPQQHPVAPAPSQDVLHACLFADPCLVEDLPPLGLQHANLTVSIIMQRVWTSQPWMHKRMEELLRALPSAYLPLFKPLTAIAITDTISHPYYRLANGAIYFPPSFLWLTQAEKTTLVQPADQRLDHIAQLAFNVRWRYLDQNKTDPFAYHGMVYPGNRTLDQVLIPFAAMLAHELAHANDFLPHQAFQLLDPYATFYDAIYFGLNDGLLDLKVSKNLYAKYPIGSRLQQTARHYYDPKASSTLQWTAQMIGEYFEYDGASSFYGSYNAEEDLAMLFEEVMMKEFFNLDRYIAFTEPSAGTNATCDDFVVRWGNRNRFAAPRVRERARFVATQLLPKHDFAPLFASTNDASRLPNNRSWCDATGAPEAAPTLQVEYLEDDTAIGASQLQQFIPHTHNNIPQ